MTVNSCISSIFVNVLSSSSGGDGGGGGGNGGGGVGNVVGIMTRLQSYDVGFESE